MTPDELIEKCFAVARSTTHEGERQAAIGRGLALCQKHGRDPDRFDIPGRPRAASAPRSHAGNAARPQRPFFRTTIDDLEDVIARQMHESIKRELAAAIARYQRSMNDAAARANAAAHETVYDARRRNFERAAAEAKRRDAARARRGSASELVSRLFAADCPTYAVGDGRYVAFKRGHPPIGIADLEELAALAELLAPVGDAA